MVSGYLLFVRAFFINVYFTGDKKNEINKCVKVSKDKRLQPREPVQWENQMFSIPAIPPTINNCKFIKVSYLLEVSHCLTNSLNMLLSLQ